MPGHNKVLRNIEIFDFVIFRDGSYYSLFSTFDTNDNCIELCGIFKGIRIWKR